MSNFTGHIFQIQRWSIHDGDGIRSTVFLKGCPLRCRWCANPESWNRAPELLFFSERCGGCGRCVQVCEHGAITMADGPVSAVLREKCHGCGKCLAVCPSGARKRIGSLVTVADVLRVIQRDAIFYRESGGGVTFSGGEPFAQPKFLRQLAAACQQLGFDTAVETSGYFDWERAKDIFAFFDSVFVDIKHMDDAVHKRLTGVGNRQILENIALMSRLRPRTIVRVPLLVGVNEGEQNIREMCEFLRRCTLVTGVEILPYHDLGHSKWNAVGAAGESFTPPNSARIDKVKEIISDYGLGIFDFK